MTFSQRALEAAWNAYQNTPIDLLADSDEETKRCVVNAITAYHDALAVDGVALQGWRTIDSAPKDGSEILATGGGLRDDIETVSYNKDAGCWLTPTCTLDDHDNDPDGYSRPAFWMPKPALPPPAASEGEERR